MKSVPSPLLSNWVTDPARAGTDLHYEKKRVTDIMSRSCIYTCVWVCRSETPHQVVSPCCKAVKAFCSSIAANFLHLCIFSFAVYLHSSTHNCICDAQANPFFPAFFRLTLIVSSFPKSQMGGFALFCKSVVNTWWYFDDHYSSSSRFTWEVISKGTIEKREIGRTKNGIASVYPKHIRPCPALNVTVVFVPGKVY